MGHTVVKSRLDKGLSEVNKEVREALEYDFKNFKDREDIEYFKEIYNQLADISEEFKNKVSRNEKTSNILFLLSSTLKEIKAYIGK